jgi:hypothetical protein
MAQLCTKCSRANPSEAVYCYFDGFVLAGHERRGGPVAVGTKPFGSPFVFPDGRTCRNFDELALACQEEWGTARGLLQEGFLESFFGGMGRVDLALTAKEAARFPDTDRGLDQVLAKLPSGVLADPQLRVDPTEVNLGLLENDQERTFDLELENRGMRLVYGTLTSDAVWLTLGDAGAGEKHFNFTHEAKIRAHVRPDRVRAGSKPTEAKLTIESNGGNVTVIVRAQKSVKAFPEGALKGARMPRQVAEKAKANPKEVAPLFESGAVAAWYASNGWTYPVKIPAASGPAAIQQFFEALGVTRPPRVEISHRELSLQGDPGANVPASLEVTSEEKKPVFAHVTSNVPWLEVSRPKFNGRSVTVGMSVPTVPNRPGETLMGELTVISNGNQRFVVPVHLEVSGGRGNFDFTAREPLPPVADAPGSPRRTPVADAPSSPRKTPVADAPGSPEPEPVKKAEKKKPEPPPEPGPRRHRPRGAPMWMHAVPAALLGLAVLGVVAFDLFFADSGKGGGEVAASGIAGPNYDPKQLRDPKPRIGVQFSSATRFGVVMLDAEDPNNKLAWKRLTFREDGSTNNTIVKISSSEYKFGFTTPSNVFLRPRLGELTDPYIGWVSTMNFKQEQIRVTQHVQVVPGQTMLLDTILIWYKVHNYGTVPQNVAVRFLLDTFIGDNDGVPFTVPGSKGFVTTQAEYKGSDVPDYLEVVEQPENEKDPGTIARLGLRGLQWSDSVELLEPARVRICRFPGGDMGWDWKPEDMGDDSCVAVYWPEQEIAPKETRHMAMTYGLGKLDIRDSLALSAPASVIPNREFVITAYVYNAVKSQKVRIELPDGVELTSGKDEIIIGEDAKRTQVFWKVKASKEGPAVFEAVSNRARARPIKVMVQAKSIFG